MMHSNGLTWMAILIGGILPIGKSFQFPPNTRSSQNAQIDVVGALYAKPPPASIFNLDSIEAFEAELEAKAQEEAAQNEILDNDFDDDSLSQEDVVSKTAEKKLYKVTAELAGKRIDAAIVALEPDLTRSACGSMVTNGLVAIVGDESDSRTPEVIKRKSFKVEEGQWLEVRMPHEKTPTEIVPQKIPLDIMYEDEHMIVINKAANMVVHPAAGNWDGTVVNALAYYLEHDSPFGPGEFHSNSDTKKALDETGEMVSFRPGVVHRLDKGTTGALVLAKTSAALTALSEAFAQRTVKKTYLAITVGNPGKRVVIDKHIERHPINRQKMRVVPDPHKSSNGSRARNAYVDPLAPQRGRRALSMVDTISFDGKLALVQVRIETGRTHQIRVHLQDRHTPIYGDDVYGLSDWNKRLSSTHKIERPLLHAFRLEIDHPVSGERMTFKAPLAEDMLRISKTIYPNGEEELPEILDPSLSPER